MIRTTLKTLGFGIAVVIILTTLQCARRTASITVLPEDILGISVGMSKDEAQKRLAEIGQLESENRKAGNLWRLKDNSRFNHLAVAYNSDNQIKFVTAFVDKTIVKERTLFSEIGELEKARKEVVEPHHRYIWETAAGEGKPAYIVNIYGDNPEYLTIYSLSKKVDADISEEDKEQIRRQRLFKNYWVNLI